MNSRKLQQNVHRENVGIHYRIWLIWWLSLISWTLPLQVQGQSATSQWIRPKDDKGAALWGVKGGIVFSLWPYGLEMEKSVYGGGPRGLIRIGIEQEGQLYLINFLAIEPVVKGKIEFSEISPSKVDGQWGKLLWAAADEKATSFSPLANTRGVISHPVPGKPEVEELSVFVSMEQYLSGAHPYLRLSIRSDRPQEIGIQVFNRADSTPMDYCNITATMGNYSRLRQLWLKDGIVDARNCYENYTGIDFIEKDPYPASAFIRSKRGDYLVFATGDERLETLKQWPTDSLAQAKRNWRYRPMVKLTQYWRKEPAVNYPGLQARVNGRYRYWSGSSRNPEHYMAIPGGAAFENFELREPYLAGQQLFFGISTQTPQTIRKQFDQESVD